MGKITAILFVLLFSIIYYSINLFVYLRIVKGLNLSDKAKKYLIIFFILLSLLFIIGEILSRFLKLNIVFIIGSIWVGVLSISFTILLLFFLLNSLLRKNQYEKLLTILSLLLIIIISGISLFKGLKYPSVKTINLIYKNLPIELDNFKIVQLSDLHLGNFNSKKRLIKIIKIANEINPDIVVITGDILDKNICKIENICHTFLKLKSRLGIFVVSGNHEFYSNYKIFLKFSSENHLIVLKNQIIKINQHLEIAGIDDNEYNRFFGKQDTNSLFNKISKERFTIYLSHKPTRFKKAVLSGVNLQLSGHTHKGQIPPMDLLVYLVYKYPYGLHKYKNGYIYTSAGTNTWGPPMRLFSNNEIVKIILKKEKG